MDFGNLFKTIAPTVGTALLGPLGGIAVSAIGNILGVTDATQSKIADVIKTGQMTPEQISKIKELELQYKNDEQERGFKYAELAYKDVDSARRMAVDTKSTTPTILSYGVLLGGGVMMACILAGLTKVDSVLAGTIIGYTVSEMKQVLQYWFGSSQGSKDKDILLAQAPSIQPGVA